MTDLLVATDAGLVVVDVPDDLSGDVPEPGAEVVHTTAVRDVAVTAVPTPDATGLAVATDEDVLLASSGAVGALAPTGFGPATAVSFDGDHLVAGGPDGRVARLADGGDWQPLGALPGAPRAIDAALVATEDGVFRLVGDGLRYAGLEAATDVAHAAGVPLAATAAGCYELGNGWMDVLSGEGRLVAGSSDGRALAATVDRAVERVDGVWRPVDWPEPACETPVAAAAFGDRPYVVTGAGDLLVGRDDGWRVLPLGLEGVRAVVAP